MSIVVDIRLFGALELKSPHGRLVERAGEKPRLFLLLKYLLLEPQRKADQEEVLRLVWTDRAVDSTAARVRLLRLREMLKPLQPEGGKSLITFKAGKYGLEPIYSLRFDTDTFVALLKNIATYPLDDLEGLRRCQEALELFRGPLMEYTEAAEWLVDYRAYYQREFVCLAHDTLKRMRALKETEPIQLVCSRALMLAPQDEQLQRDILRFLTDYQLEEKLTEHIRRLTLTGQAGWMRTEINTPKEIPTAYPAETKNYHSVYVRLFSDVELGNEHGHIIENCSRTPLLLLKYLLIKYPKNVTMDEILQLWPVSKAGVNPETTVAVRLRRAREALRPLQLDKKNGLIHYRDGVFQINPAYTLTRDVDDFEDFKKMAAVYSLDNSEGLKLCVKALEVYRGPLMEYTPSAPWLEEYRAYYRAEFCQLAVDTLNRIRVLKTDEALSLLTQRAAAIAPECQSLHESIIRYLVEQKRELELTRYLSLLARSGKANWMEKPLLV